MASLRTVTMLPLRKPPAVRVELAHRRFSSDPLRGCLAINSKGRFFEKERQLLQRPHQHARQCLRPYTSAPAIDPTPQTAQIPNSTVSSNPKPPLGSRFLISSSIFLLFLVGGFAMSAAPAAGTVNGWVSPPTDEETLSLVLPETQRAEEVNERIVSSPLALKLRAQGFTESRPHVKIPEAMRSHNLTAGVLMGAEKLEVPPLFFADKEAELPSLVQIAYLGPSLCGHEGIVHGGMLATLLDEGLARCCFPALPSKVGVTASLKIDYRNPCPADSYIVLKAETTKVEGRKAWVKGWIELLDDQGNEGTGVKIVEAEALFIEPRNAKNMTRVYRSQ